MTFVTKKHLSRRAMLRGIGGAAISLPLLDSMIPALTAQTKTAANVAPRLGFVYIPHGAVMDKWTPVGTGSDFEFGPVLSALQRHRENVIVLSNLCHHHGRSAGRRRRGPFAQHGHLVERHARQEDRGRGRARRHHHRSNCSSRKSARRRASRRSKSPPKI